MGIKILRTTDRLTIKIGEVELKLAPLSMFQRQELLAHVEKADGNNIHDVRKGTTLAMKYSIKDISGIETLDGDTYKLEFDAENSLTDNCVNELLNTEVSGKMVLAAYSMIYGMPSEIRDSEGKRVEGVEVVLGKSQEVPMISN